MQATRKEGKNGFETNETHNQSEDRMVFRASSFSAFKIWRLISNLKPPILMVIND